MTGRRGWMWLAIAMVVTWFELPGGAVGGSPRLVASDHTDYSGVGVQLVLNGRPAGVSSGFFDAGTAGGIGSATWRSR